MRWYCALSDIENVSFAPFFPPISNKICSVKCKCSEEFIEKMEFASMILRSVLDL